MGQNSYRPVHTHYVTSSYIDTFKKVFSTKITHYPCENNSENASIHRDITDYSVTLQSTLLGRNLSLERRIELYLTVIMKVSL